ncbi:hypothetical protein BKA69DRAFT_1105925 [Paraphysoderma sedebokerense]|nr:hypothetical protein BKA69DRAFT_1105925 [Paraphysoderma sedebokerense]
MTGSEQSWESCRMVVLIHITCNDCSIYTSWIVHDKIFLTYRIIWLLPLEVLSLGLYFVWIPQQEPPRFTAISANIFAAFQLTGGILKLMVG